jgi:TRAP-type C4-dicarboxylate transport system substrate-binding protein
LTSLRAMPTRGIAVLAALLMLASACHAGPGGKSGTQTVTLRFATVDPEVNNNGQMAALSQFVAQVQHLSRGRLRLQVTTNLGDGRRGAEEALLRAIRAGKYDGGWNATRAFAPAGFPGFEVLEAPFVVQSYTVEHQVVTGLLAVRMLARLRGTGLTGLALVAGPLRRPFSTRRPLTRPADWSELAFRVYDSTVEKAAVTALDARPVTSGAAALESQLRSGMLGGHDFDIGQYQANGFADLDRYATGNLAMWPKVYALVMNARRLSSLTTQQRSWLRAAAQKASRTSPTSSFDEEAAARRMCLTGLHFVYVDAEELAALRAAEASVYAMLQRDPTTAADLAELRKDDAADPRPSSAAVGSACRGPAPPTRVVDTTVTTRPQIPDGDYRVTITEGDIERLGGQGVHASGNAGVATMTFNRGTYAAYFIFAGTHKAELVEAGRLRGTPDTVVFYPDASIMRRLGSDCSGCSDLSPPYSFGYRYSAGQLRFTVGAGMHDPVILAVATSHPWLRLR